MCVPADKRGQQAARPLSKTGETLKGVVSTACRPGVFQIALFKGFPNILRIPPPPSGHSVGTNEATMAATPENAQGWHNPHRCKGVCPLAFPLPLEYMVLQITTPIYITDCARAEDETPEKKMLPP